MKHILTNVVVDSNLSKKSKDYNQGVIDMFFKLLESIKEMQI